MRPGWRAEHLDISQPQKFEPDQIEGISCCNPRCFQVQPAESSRNRPRMGQDGRGASSQIEIAKAFRALVQRREAARGWKLLLVGSVNEQAYFNEVCETVAGVNAEGVGDADFATVRSAFARASVYVHASGYGRDEQFQPELIEHFGISVAEAAASGCALVVYGCGGPSEIVSKIGEGFRFKAFEELVDALGAAVSMDDAERKAVMTRTAAGSAIFREDRMHAKLGKVVDLLASGRLD